MGKNNFLPICCLLLKKYFQTMCFSTPGGKGGWMGFKKCGNFHTFLKATLNYRFLIVYVYHTCMVVEGSMHGLNRFRMDMTHDDIS